MKLCAYPELCLAPAQRLAGVHADVRRGSRTSRAEHPQQWQQHRDHGIWRDAIVAQHLAEHMLSVSQHTGSKRINRDAATRQGDVAADLSPACGHATSAYTALYVTF